MLAMGLARLDPARWIEPDNALAQYHQNKLNQRALHGAAVYRDLPESADAQTEFQALLLSHLTTRHGADYQREGQDLVVPALGLRWPVAGDEPLWQSSLWIQDDICLLQESPEGYRLTAASLCAASFWRLEEKLGQPLQGIHAPVPGFAEKLAPQVDRFFAHIKPDYPVWRANWSVVASPNLNQRSDYPADVRPDAPLYLRVERQALRRLPVTRAVVFSIRVYVHPLQQLRGEESVWRGLNQAINTLSPAQRRYKGIHRVQPALQASGFL